MHRLFRFFLVLALISPMTAQASGGGDEHHDGPHVERTKEEQAAYEKEKNGEFVKHHTKDDHSFGILVNQSKNKHYGFPLPVILYDEGFHFFMSSSLDHGHKVVESNGKYFRLNAHDGRIYNTDAEGHVVTTTEFDKKAGEDVETPVSPLDFSITKNVLVTFLMCLLMFFLFRGIARSYKTGLAPTGAAKFFEPIILFIRDDIARPNIGEEQHKRYMVYLLTIFFFIWFLNLAGMTPFGVNVTGNLAFTAALATMTFAITTFTGNKNYWMHIFWMPGVPVPMKIILIPIELIGMVVKPFALMIRLYANMLAGHIVLGMLIVAAYSFENYLASGAFIGLTFFMNIIELLVAVLQAYIFTMLTALYFGAASATAEHH